MIKVQNNTATREALPAFLLGLRQESLLDLSWTDPALGVQDCGWWPEEDQSPSLGEFEIYGGETLTVDADRKIVLVVKNVERMSDEDIAALTEAKATNVRAKRNEELSASDWIVIMHTEKGTNIPAAWEIYRQSLRDITSQPGFPHNVTWPTKP
jgi:hypothetical protein